MGFQWSGPARKVAGGGVLGFAGGRGAGRGGSGGSAEDVGGAALDVGVDVILAAVVGEEGVLVAEEATVLEYGSIAAVGSRDRLAGVAGGILEGDVVGLEAGAVDLDGFG